MTQNKIGLIFCFISILLIFGCAKKSDTKNEVIISFDGGSVTSGEIIKRAGPTLELLKKRQKEIEYRVAMEILLEKIKNIEGGSFETATTANTGNRDGKKNGTEKKNAAGRLPEPSMTEPSKKGDVLLKNIFKKYNVKINIPEN